MRGGIEALGSCGVGVRGWGFEVMQVFSLLVEHGFGRMLGYKPWKGGLSVGYFPKGKVGRVYGCVFAFLQV